ncbi:phosphatase PAP2 family protein [Candidatus Saccharibacteria bacterium]|nr:phosphatase PAP2 family protein [Candidatus Saccharibacteria bacterium]MBR6122022.1 phosphatase PAP2 family protein [Candidatus Saccharibacteria bacterium]
MKESKKSLILCIICAVLAIAFTAVVYFTGLRDALGAFSYSDLWYKITKYSGYALFLPVAFFVLLGFVQLIKRRSFKKVDRELKLLALFYLAVAIVYLVFEKFLIINYRPIMLDGKLESSYPSSHTLFAVALCGSAMLLTKRFLKLKHATLVNIVLVLLMLVTVVGRLLSGVHWATDIIGGVLIGATLIFAFATALKAKPAKTKE